ncbi:MAG TPA: TOBE domain-containing protein [Stenotrophomonas sp.]|nr:TOBE domain-containing protein [Stenotrophomonas sp.]
MNLLQATLHADGCLVGEGFRLQLSPPVTTGSTEVVLGIRPQGLRLAPRSADLAMQVTVVEYLGTESVLVGHLHGQPDTRLAAVVPGHRTDLLHQRVDLDIAPAQIHLFDRSSGARLAS